MQQIPQSLNHNEEIEFAVIGNALFSPELGPELCANLVEDDFTHDFLRVTFRKIRECVSEFRPYNHLIITDMLKTHFKANLWHGTPIAWYVSKTMENVNYTPFLSQMCMVLNNYRKSRQLLRISDLAREDLPPDEKQRQIQQILLSTESVKMQTSWVKIGHVIDDYYEFYYKNQGRDIQGIPFGIPKLDYLTGGAVNENLIIIAARPSVGKSALAQQICVNMAAQSMKTVGIVTLEMSNNELISRMLSYCTGLDYDQLSRLKVEPEVVSSNLMKMRDLQIVFSDETKCSIEGIRASVFKLMKTVKLNVLVIDYLQLMESETKTNSRNDEIGKISRGLKEMAKQLSIPVIALAQLNREGAGGGPPKLHHLRDSGSIEQDADKVIFITGEIGQTERHLIVEKNRGGKVGSVQCEYVAEKMAFIQVEQTYNGESQTTNLF